MAKFVPRNQGTVEAVMVQNGDYCIIRPDGSGELVGKTAFEAQYVPLPRG